MRHSHLPNHIKLLICLLASISAPALAESCLNYDTKRDSYADGDSRSATYVKCKPGEGSGSYGALNAIGQQMQGMMERSNSNDRGYSDAEREAYRRQDQAYKDGQSERRSNVKYGAWAELGGIDYSKYQYQNATIPAAAQQAIRQEIGTVIASGKLLETYGSTNYADSNTWNGSDASTRWKNCEVATQLVRAYVYGDFIKPEQKNPALGYAIAKTGRYQHCGGTAYWLGRILEAGNPLVPGVDKDENENNGGKSVKSAIEGAYGTAILNGYTPAHERMAELYRLGGPERFRGKTYFVLTDFASYPIWRKRKNDSDEMYLMRMQYSKCLEADPANLVCARGLVTLYSDEGKDFLDGYSNYNPKLASFYANYAKELEALLVKAGLPVPPAG